MKALNKKNIYIYNRNVYFHGFTSGVKRFSISVCIKYTLAPMFVIDYLNLKPDVWGWQSNQVEK